MKKPSPVHIDLEIPSHADEISGYVKMVLSKLTDHIAIDLGTERRIKLILIELITNSIKHSTDDNGLIKLTISHPGITIQKVDKGLHIELKTESLPFREINKTLKVSFSEQNNHQIKILDKYKFQFLDPFKEELSLDYMPEHFGLYIITLAADVFIYQYDPDRKENSFIVSINM